MHDVATQVARPGIPSADRDRAARPADCPSSVAFDRSVGVLVFKVGRYPIDYGGLAVVRSLGRVGVSVRAVVESRLTPTACSRYLAEAIRWPTTGAEPIDELVAGLLRLGRRAGDGPVLIPTDDEAAIVLAGHRSELSAWFRLPEVAPELPALMASKRGLYELCARLCVPTPVSLFPSSRLEVTKFADSLGYPVVVKNAEPWARISEPAVPSTLVVTGREELAARAASWPANPSVVLQEYLPEESCADWIFHGQVDRHLVCQPAFTARKLWSWPLRAGVTVRAVTVENPELIALSADLCRQIGYRGIVDMDWRFDHRDGRYKLLDVNPRPGAQFRLFETSRGLDVVRALHLELTGRRVPADGMVTGRRYVVEHLDVLARRGAGKGVRRYKLPSPGLGVPHERAWWAGDDPLPAVAMATRCAVLGALRGVGRRWRREPWAG